MAVALGGRRSFFVMSVRQAALAASRWQVEGVGLEAVGVGADVDGPWPRESPGRRSACSNAHGTLAGSPSPTEDKVGHAVGVLRI